MAAPVVVMAQPQVTTTIITNQRNDWNTQVCACCDDLGICCFAAWCMPCFQCKTVSEFGECMCLPLMDNTCNSCGYCNLGPVPPMSLAMRVGVRERYNIPGAIFNDCCIMYWCNSCGWCQIARELKARKNAVTVINASTSILPHPSYVAQPVYMPQPAYMPQPVYPPNPNQSAPPYQK